MRALAALSLALLPACTTASGLTRLDSMDEQEFVRYEARVVAQVQAIAAFAVKEGDLDLVEIETLQAVLTSLADGTVTLGGLSLVEHLQLDGYGALALVLAAQELEARFEMRGAYEEDGALSPRARDVLRAVAASLAELKPLVQPPDA